MLPFTYPFFQSHIFKQHNRTERISQPLKATSYGQLVMLGCDVTVYTPASYQRHRL